MPDEVKNSITDEQVMNLLFGDDAVVVGDATISMEKDYVFYLLWECANESFGIQLKEIKVVMNKEWDTIDVWAWWEVLTKTKTLDQKDLNAKVSIFSMGWKIWEKKKPEDNPRSNPNPGTPKNPDDPSSQPGTTWDEITGWGSNPSWSTWGNDWL